MGLDKGRVESTLNGMLPNVIHASTHVNVRAGKTCVNKHQLITGK